MADKLFEQKRKTLEFSQGIAIEKDGWQEKK